MKDSLAISSFARSSSNISDTECEESASEYASDNDSVQTMGDHDSDDDDNDEEMKESNIKRKEVRQNVKVVKRASAKDGEQVGESKSSSSRKKSRRADDDESVDQNAESKDAVSLEGDSNEAIKPVKKRAKPSSSNSRPKPVEQVDDAVEEVAADDNLKFESSFFRVIEKRGTFKSLSESLGKFEKQHVSVIKMLSQQIKNLQSQLDERNGPFGGSANLAAVNAKSESDIEGICQRILTQSMFDKIDRLSRSMDVVVSNSERSWQQNETISRDLNSLVRFSKGIEDRMRSLEKLIPNIPNLLMPTLAAIFGSVHNSSPSDYSGASSVSLLGPSSVSAQANAPVAVHAIASASVMGPVSVHDPVNGPVNGSVPISIPILSSASSTVSLTSEPSSNVKASKSSKSAKPSKSSKSTIAGADADTDSDELQISI